jgi:tetratricopeptide (TPR) repeat protein
MHISIRKMFVTAALLLGCFLMPIITAEAQITGIKGVVTDANTGQRIANAQLLFQRQDIVRNVNAKTNSKGEYSYLLGSQSGTFRIIVHMQGYQPAHVENVRAELGNEAVQDFKLFPGEDRKTVFEMTEQEKAEYEKKHAEQQNAATPMPKMADAVRAKLSLALKLASENKYAESIDEFNKVIEKLPKDASVAPLHIAVAEAYLKIEKKEDALASYQTAVQLKPDAAYLTNMGVLLNSMGKTAESQEAFKKAAELNPGSAADSFYKLGVTLVNDGKTDEAAASFKKSIEADANYAESYYQLGICLSGKPETMSAATEALKKYLKIGQKPDQIEVAKQIITALGGK